LTRSAHKPRQTDLKRAVSTAYYAMFNFLAGECADLFIGGGVARKSSSWVHVHRALEHSFAKNACGQARVPAFPPEIVRFAKRFIHMQEHRHNADYDPSARYARADVIAFIDDVDRAIEGFKSTPRSDRLAFATLVLLRKR
jgi:uncharacterized protein (UPF0332 family)